MSAEHPSLSVGSLAPDFSLPRDGGDTVALSHYSGRPVVLFFYPKDNTPACTNEAIGFSALSDQFAAINAAVIGISADNVKSHDKFVKKHNLRVILGSDETHSVLEAYGVWKEKSMYGKTYMGIERTTFLIDGNGKIARIWEKVKVDGHAEDVLAAARAL
ncbi:thioredoxin-dependent thiol peroxidase [Gellertiella hungarica]|uniref:thioredoxin-dependent peroxiredoxin n=1 Tax=Gellertiella hungarica TaxID=1572859 RepID=A0A7W6J4H6_9HYPH|nr:thioredoxin-dependent thiol peroxidase [Gellertiella hungarica]MBB4064666.1 peroxiredoxin Q/BCP [Gellertiella hungarica]